MKRPIDIRPFKAVLLYGLLLGLVLIAFKLFEYSYFSHRLTLDLYLGVVAVAFLLVGIIVGVKGDRMRRREPSVQATPDAPVVPLELPPDLDLSRRELEVLSHLVEGRTNQEIAEALFVSPNTVKTHVSNIYRKLDVERRAQAVARAKELQIVG